VGQQQTNLSVLVVNDEPNQLIVLQEVLRDAGFCGLAAADGDEGFDVAKPDPDLVISDVTMPRVSGIELCRLILMTSWMYICRRMIQTLTLPV
jgi:CheY-like chemotaxis protein